MPIKVAVNGFGTIGKRIALAILRDPDFKLVGVAKYTPDFKALVAVKHGIKLFVPREKEKEFKGLGIEPEGYIDYLLEEAELIYDASPGGQGAKNKELYLKLGKPSVFQGGEKANVAEVSYNTLCNYEEAIGKRYVRIVSCNTTGILRLLCSIGVNSTRRAFITIIRRASDPVEDLRGPVNSIKIDMESIPSHHGIDARSVIRDLNIDTVAVAVPTTLMHMHVAEIILRDRCVDLQTIVEASRGRIALVSSKLLDTTGKMMELARDLGRPRSDWYENILFKDLYTCRDGVAIVTQAIHQEAIVIPENIDVAYAMMNLETDPVKVIEKVNRVLGVGLTIPMP